MSYILRTPKRKTNMIDVQNITFRYSSKSEPVFHNFCLQLEQNKVYGLLGENGTGKSTLLYLLMGLLRPEEGIITVDNADMAATYDFFGAMPFNRFLTILFWRNMMVLAFFSFFIWFGTAFRRAGWVYAIIVIFVLLALFILVLEIMGILHDPAPRSLRYIWGYGVPLLSILFTYLAYRSFCRAQIVTHKIFTL